MKFSIWKPNSYFPNEIHYYNHDKGIKGYINTQTLTVIAEANIDYLEVSWGKPDLFLHGDSIIDVIKNNPELLL